MLKELISQGESFRNSKKLGEFSLPDYIDNDGYQDWKREALMFLQVNYPDNLQTKDFSELRNSDKFYDYETMLSILRAFDKFAK